MDRASAPARRWSSPSAAERLTPTGQLRRTLCASLLVLAALGAGTAPGAPAEREPGAPAVGQPARDLHRVLLSPGRNEALVRFEPAGTGTPGERRFAGGDRDRFARVEPGQSYLLPESLWDRFTGNRSGPFRIEVRTRADEAVLASGRLVEQGPAPDGDALWVFEGDDRDRGLGLYVVARRRGVDGLFPAPPAWARDFLAPILAALGREFGPLPGERSPEVVMLDFPTPSATAFPGALLVDERLARGDEAPPAGRLAVLAHEAAHLWWGNAVEAGAADGGATMMEGLAEFGACRAVGEIAGPEAESARWAALRDEYLLASEAAAAASATVLRGYEPFGRGLRYARAAWLIRMLRARVGAPAFAAALGRLRSAPRPAGWEELLAAAGAAAGVPLDDFRRHWLEAARHPDPVLEVAAATPGSVRVANRSAGAGEIPVAFACGGGAPLVVFVSLTPGATSVTALPPSVAARDCQAHIDPGGEFLLGPPGPPPAPGLILGRGWGFPVVRSVRPGSPAERAGFRGGDLVIGVGDRPLAERDADWLQRELAAGRSVLLRIRRGREVQEIAWPGRVP